MIGKIKLSLLLIFFTVGIFILYSPRLNVSAAGDRIEDVVMYEDKVILMPLNKEYVRAPLFNVSEGVEKGYFYSASEKLNVVMISGYNIKWPQNKDGDTLSGCVEIDSGTGEVYFEGTEAEARERLGYEYEVNLTLKSDNGDTMNLTLTVLLLDDVISFDRSCRYLLSPDEISTAKLFLGSADVLDAEWTSNDTSVIKVTGNTADKGLTAKIEGVKQGTAIVTATVRTRDTTITVSHEYAVNRASSEASLNLNKVTLYKGESVELFLSNLPKGAVVSYKSNKAKIAAVNKKTGRITAKKAGKATITVTVKAPSTKFANAKTYKLKCKVTVKKAVKTTLISTTEELKKFLTSGKGGNGKLSANIKNVDFCISVNSGSYRLDLNGHTIKGDGNGTMGGILDVNGGSLTIIDSAGKGGIENTYSQEAVGCLGGKLNIYGGNIKGYCYAVYCEGGTTGLYGGTYSAYGDAAVVYTGKLNIYGGNYSNIASDSRPYMSSYGGLIVGGIGSAVVYGGNFTGECGIMVNGSDALLVINNINIISDRESLWLSAGDTEINGGRFEAKSSNALFTCPVAYPVNLDVNGGEFIVDDDENTVFLQNECNAIINGGWFDNTADRENIWEYNTYLHIADSFKGTFDIMSQLVDEKEISDMTPAGQGMDDVEYKRIKIKYKDGMTVDSLSEIYSIYLNSAENLVKHIDFECNREILRQFNYFFNKWMLDMTGVSIKIGSEMKTDGKCTCSIDFEYDVLYELQNICADPNLVSAASKEAQKYAVMIEEIVAECSLKSNKKLDIAGALHDYMCRNYTYDYSYDSESYNPMGLLKNKTGVCQGYATLYQCLCARAGIDCVLIKGWGGEPGTSYELHAWNMVTIDGKELYVDVTFDDSAGTDKWCLKDKKTFYGYGYHITSE